MKLSRTVRFNPALFGFIPFVNVLFLVLIFFALSTRFSLQPGLSVSLPFSDWMLGPQRNPQILSITGGPAPAIYFRSRKVAVEDLPRALAENRAKERTLILRADRATPYDLVMRVMNDGLRAGFSVVLASSPRRP